MILDGGCSGRLYCFVTDLMLTEIVISKVPRVIPHYHPAISIPLTVFLAAILVLLHKFFNTITVQGLSDILSEQPSPEDIIVV